MDRTDQAIFDMLLPAGETFKPAQLAAAFGRSETYIRDQIEAGHLAAIKAAGRAPRAGERRCRGEANTSFLILRRDALIWLCESYTQTPEDFQQRLCDLIDRCPIPMRQQLFSYLSKKVHV